MRERGLRGLMSRRGQMMFEELVKILLHVVSAVVVLAILVMLILFFFRTPSNANAENEFKNFINRYNTFEESDVPSQEILLALENSYLIIGFDKGKDRRINSILTKIMSGEDEKHIARVREYSSGVSNGHAEIANPCPGHKCICLFRLEYLKKDEYWHEIACENVQKSALIPHDENYLVSPFGDGANVVVAAGAEKYSGDGIVESNVGLLLLGATEIALWKKEKNFAQTLTLQRQGDYIIVSQGGKKDAKKVTCAEALDDASEPCVGKLPGTEIGRGVCVEKVVNGRTVCELSKPVDRSTPYFAVRGLDEKLIANSVINAPTGVHVSSTTTIEPVLITPDGDETGHCVTNVILRYGTSEAPREKTYEYVDKDCNNCKTKGGCPMLPEGQYSNTPQGIIFDLITQTCGSFENKNCDQLLDSAYTHLDAGSKMDYALSYTYVSDNHHIEAEQYLILNR